MAYGYEVKELDDRKVDAARKMVQLSGETLPPGALLVNDLPFCDRSLLCWDGLDAHSHQCDTSLNGFLG
jgi:hypothetical protein